MINLKNPWVQLAVRVGLNVATVALAEELLDDDVSALVTGKDEDEQHDYEGVSETTTSTKVRVTEDWNTKA
jgi:hypothetical protein